MSMKICLINNLYPPHARGGAEQVVYKTVQGLLEAGHEVVVITTVPEGPHVWREGRLTIYRVVPKNLFFYTAAHQHSFLTRALWHLIDMFHAGVARTVAEILRQEKPEVVHTHNLMGVSFLVPRIIRELGIRHLHTVHDVQLVEPSGIILKAKENSWRYRGLPTRAYTAIMRRLMGSPDVVISPSQFLLDFYEKRGFFPGAKRVVLRNPVTMSLKHATASGRGPDQGGKNTKTLKQNFINESHGVNFLYLGQIEEHKGVVFLVNVFRSFGNDQAVLHIVGAGSQFERVKEMASVVNTIIVHGKVDRDKLPELFAETDVLIVPSLCYENSPTVIFEAFSFGVPVLASRVEGVAELIREGENGLTFETGNEASLKEKLTWCVEHREDLQAMSKKTAQSLHGLSERDYIERLQYLYV